MTKQYQEKTAFEQAVEAVQQGNDAKQAAQDLYQQLTLDEKLTLLDGDQPFWEGMNDFLEIGYNTVPYVHGEISRLGIPGTRFIDGPRGCVAGHGTAFPVSMARGATWDPELEERVGEAIGTEVREMGGNFFGGVCINLPRHPAWGRVQETYSDQPVLLGEMGAALARGVQHNAIACVKHFACNSMENARFQVDVTVDEATLHEVYLPHFKKVIEAGAQAVMSSYNSVNGEWAGQNHYLLTEVLRDMWHFDGLVGSDFIWGLRNPIQSLRAGLDLEEPFAQQRNAVFAKAIESGELQESELEPSGVRIIENLIRLYAHRWSEEPRGTMASDAHLALARETAARAVTVLKNEQAGRNAQPVLPLRPEQHETVALFGSLAHAENTGDHGSSDVRSPKVVTLLEGLRNVYGNQVDYMEHEQPEQAALRAQQADVAIVVVGFTAADEGEYVDGSIAVRDDILPLYPQPRNAHEQKLKDAVLTGMGGGGSVVGGQNAGGDRSDLHLKQADVELIRAVAAANPRTVVVIVSAGAVLMEEWIDTVPSVVLGWYSGAEGGNGIADVLCGKVNADGRMPYPIPASADDLPYLDINATAITYTRDYGQRLISKRGSQALFPLGWGLSYTTWQLRDAALRDVSSNKQSAVCTVTVANTGDMDGHHVAQLYATYQSGPRAGERELVGFQSVFVPAGRSVCIDITADLNAIGVWNTQTRNIEVKPGEVTFEVASYWGDPDAQIIEVTL